MKKLLKSLERRWYCGEHYDIESPEVCDNGFVVYNCPYCGERDAVPTCASGRKIDQILRKKTATMAALDLIREYKGYRPNVSACLQDSADSLREFFLAQSEWI